MLTRICSLLQTPPLCQPLCPIPSSPLVGIVLLSSGPLEGTTQGATQWDRGSHQSIGFCKTTPLKEKYSLTMYVCPFCNCFVWQTKPLYTNFTVASHTAVPAVGSWLEMVTSSLFLRVLVLYVWIYGQEI